MQLDSADDVRGSVWVVVLDMVGRYFPAGTGFGTFDPAFRISEPHGMLASQYINHAHNDWLEVVLDGGIVGLALVLGGLAWFVWRSYGAWFRSAHRDSPDDTALARAGSAIILLVFIASIPDYPARTPMIMAMVALGALWMTPSPERYRERRGRSPEDRSAPLR
ncbi:O-antigen ligase family protein [Leptolyngbya sp. 7M]|nr:O-antigen ligase family protein [Leptolyngbya sp. 7M]